MRDFHMRAGRSGREFPPDHGVVIWGIVPVTDPGIGENAGRIKFDDLAVTLELTYAIHDVGSLIDRVAVATTGTGIHLPVMNGVLGTGEPARELGGVGEGLKNARRRRGDLNLADDGVLIGCNDSCGHSSPIYFACFSMDFLSSDNTPGQPPE